jgi:hypothetical protein
MSTRLLGPALRFELCKEAMKSLEKSGYKDPWSGGWDLIRALGKEHLNNWRADDASCADAVIMNVARTRQKN